MSESIYHCGALRLAVEQAPSGSWVVRISRPSAANPLVQEEVCGQELGRDRPDLPALERALSRAAAGVGMARGVLGARIARLGAHQDSPTGQIERWLIMPEAEHVPPDETPPVAVAPIPTPEDVDAGWSLPVIVEVGPEKPRRKRGRGRKSKEVSDE